MKYFALILLSSLLLLISNKEDFVLNAGNQPGITDDDVQPINE